MNKRWPRIIYNWTPQGNQRRGQPRKLRKEGILQAMTNTGMEPDWQKWYMGTARQQTVV